MQEDDIKNTETMQDFYQECEKILPNLFSRSWVKDHRFYLSFYPGGAIATIGRRESFFWNRSLLVRSRLG